MKNKVKNPKRTKKREKANRKINYKRMNLRKIKDQIKLRNKRN